MARPSIPRIITNRQLNFTLSPVDTYNKKEMPYRLQNYEIDGTWNQHQSIILDVLLDRIFNGHFKEYKNIPKSWRSPYVIQENKKFAGALFHPVILKFLSNKPVDAFSMNQGYDVVATERKNYDDASSGEDKKATFEEHFENYLNDNNKYQTFIAEMTRNVAVFRKDIPMKLTISKLLKKYPILNQRPYKGNLFEYLQKIASTKFRMNYKLRCIVKAPEYSDKGKRTHKGIIADGYYAYSAAL